MAITIADREKIKNLFNEGIQTLSDIEDLKGGLKDTVKAVADELQVKPGVLMKALNIEFKRTQGKGSLDEEQEAISDIEAILIASGRLAALGE